MHPQLERHLNRPVKEVIAEFPQLTAILDEYEIGCGACQVGTCLFKDIVEIHNLEPEAEGEMMARLGAAISSDGQPELRAPRPAPRKGSGKELSASIKRLVEEHVLIKRLLALIPALVGNVDASSREGKEIIAAAVDFIRSYADRFHHGKEEDILFKYFDEKSDIITAMHSDHETGRGHVKAVMEALEKGNSSDIASHLQAYRELLLAHIQKEDEILFPWMDRNLSDGDRDALAASFDNAEREMGADLPAKYASLIAEMEEKVK